MVKKSRQRVRGIPRSEMMKELEMAAKSAIDALAQSWSQDADRRFHVRCYERKHATVESVHAAGYAVDDPIMIDMADRDNWISVGSEVYSMVHSAFRDYEQRGKEGG